MDPHWQFDISIVEDTVQSLGWGQRAEFLATLELFAEWLSDPHASTLAVTPFKDDKYPHLWSVPWSHGLMVLRVLKAPTPTILVRRLVVL